MVVPLLGDLICVYLSQTNKNEQNEQINLSRYVRGGGVLNWT